MSRIRTIKPEFPQSETIGRLSRDARLLFVQLWTIADDSGKARAASRMLASLLYPYDDDAPSLIEGWLTELEEHECVRRYQSEGGTYLEIINWLKHQKIDKPSKSKIPPFDEASRIVAKPREESTTDLGPRTSTKDLGSEEDAPSGATPTKYAFESGVIRLNLRDLTRWKASYSHLDVPGELEGISEWAGTVPNWFHAVKSVLAKRNREAGIRLEAQRNGVAAVRTPAGNPWPEGIT